MTTFFGLGLSTGFVDVGVAVFCFTGVDVLAGCVVVGFGFSVVVVPDVDGLLETGGFATTGSMEICLKPRSATRPFLARAALAFSNHSGCRSYITDCVGSVAYPDRGLAGGDVPLQSYRAQLPLGRADR